MWLWHASQSYRSYRENFRRFLCLLSADFLSPHFTFQNIWNISLIGQRRQQQKPKHCNYHKRSHYMTIYTLLSSSTKFEHTALNTHEISINCTETMYINEVKSHYTHTTIDAE